MKSKNNKRKQEKKKQWLKKQIWKKKTAAYLTKYPDESIRRTPEAKQMRADSGPTATEWSKKEEWSHTAWINKLKMVRTLSIKL